MTDNNNNNKPKIGTLSLVRGSAPSTLNQSIMEKKLQSRSSSKVVQVEVKRTRTKLSTAPTTSATAASEANKNPNNNESLTGSLTEHEHLRRLEALKQAASNPTPPTAPKLPTHDISEETTTIEEIIQPETPIAEPTEPQVTVEEIEEPVIEPKSQGIITSTSSIKHLDHNTSKVGLKIIEQPKAPVQQEATTNNTHKIKAVKPGAVDEIEDEEASNKKVTKVDIKSTQFKTRWEERKSHNKLNVQALGDEDDEGSPKRGRSLASIKRARDKAKRLMHQHDKDSAEKIIREVILPEVITVQELANRMAERSADVIKELMKLGIMATLSHSVDADTAELIIHTFGHKVKRVTEADIENSLIEAADDDDTLLPRAPVVTVMGHVDHGKTSLLDAIRSTDVAAGEAGGITQHIGAYQIELANGEHITFLDTPGHEAFTAIRSRGVNVTDIVVLIVAADDSIMAQTIEAINHAKAANVPIIVAINKIDKEGANPDRVRNELLSHELVPEELGGDVMVVEISAKQKLNIDKLEEAILLQSQFMDLKANPNRAASGAVIEAKVDKGRGVVATLLVQRGTLKPSDIIIAGSTFGRVRAIYNDKGQQLDSAGPSIPVEITGLSEAPQAGDTFVVVNNEKQAREIAEFRYKKAREIRTAVSHHGTLADLLSKSGANKLKELPLIIKGDVHGSIEAINASLAKLPSDQTKVKILHSAVGGINESDISLAKASNAIIIGFNVRANVKAKEIAEKEGVEIYYYSIIYELIDSVKSILSGMLSPIIKEQYIGTVSIRQVFNISKVGKIAGCMVTGGIIKRGAKIRLLRDNIVIYEGKLKTLKRMKDDVKEVKEGFECGIELDNYDDIKVGDTIEVFEIIQEKQVL
jgi:translation initiation factor IF-2